jgi:RNA recognition motif-containing protein
MQSSSSGGDRNSRNSRSRGGRSRSRNGRSGGDHGEGRRPSQRKSDGPDEFRPSEDVNRRPRRESSKTAPKPTAFQKFIKFITFGLVDPTAKKPAGKTSGKPSDRPAREPRAPRGEEDGSGTKRERRAPMYVEPTTPRLYIGNLSYDVTNADLETLFGAHGSVVEAAVVTQAGSEKSKGFAFVEMGSVEEAKAAAAALNDHEVQGRKMLVTGAKSEGREEKPAGRSERAPRGERPERTGGRGDRKERGERGERGRGGRTRGGDSDEIDKPSRQVRPLVIETVTSPSLNLANLNAEASETDVTDLFSGIGTIVSREETGPGKDERTKNHRIDLASTEEAQKAVELLDGKCFMGHEIKLTGVKAEG